jgi:CubicO group peptidase (beta-lactamase class C family)
VSEKVFPGCVAGVADRFGVRLIIPFGRFTYEESEPEVRESTIYDTASITKAIPLSCLALRLIEEGRLHPGKRLIEFVPELLNPDREEVLIQHLLTHTLHFGFPLSSLREGSPEDIMDAILKRPFHSKPGRFFSYANATSLLLGLVVERLYGESLEEAAQGEFFSPLRMTPRKIQERGNRPDRGRPKAGRHPAGRGARRERLGPLPQRSGEGGENHPLRFRRKPASALHPGVCRALLHRFRPAPVSSDAPQGRQPRGEALLLRGYGSAHAYQPDSPFTSQHRARVGTESAPFHGPIQLGEHFRQDGVHRLLLPVRPREEARPCAPVQLHLPRTGTRQGGDQCRASRRRRSGFFPMKCTGIPIYFFLNGERYILTWSVLVCTKKYTIQSTSKDYIRNEEKPP